MIGGYKDLKHETHTITFTSQENVQVVLPQVSFNASILKYSFLALIILVSLRIKEKCSPFNQSIIQQPIMSINKVITPMTELSDPSS